MSVSELNKIDLLIAEHVFGWTRVTTDDEQPDQVPYLRDGSGRVFYPAVAAKFPHLRLLDVPAYASDMNHAWAVIEKLKADGWRFDVGDNNSYLRPAGPDEQWYADASRVVTGDDGFDQSEEQNAVADTAPLAICRAALAAKGIEVPK